MQSLRQLFEAYGGDYEGTMARFLGREALYRKFLGMLLQDPNLGDLGEALEAGDLPRAFEAAHTLKGVVGNMGLIPYVDAVCAIVEPLRTGARDCDYAALYAVLQAEHARVEDLYKSIVEGGASV